MKDTKWVSSEEIGLKIRNEILEISLEALSVAFDSFIGECLTEDEEIKLPDRRAMMKARGYLPPYCEHALSKKHSKKCQLKPV